MATAYGCRPSEFFHLETEIAAWALDEACLVEGRRVENALNEGKDPFTLTLPSPTGRGGYAPAPKRNVKRMKIPESGVW
jgi:hypothetical protein